MKEYFQLSFCFGIALVLFAIAPTAIGGDLGTNRLEKRNIGGVAQWLLVRSRDDSNPVLLFLHGGPGIPITPFYRDLDANGDLESKFVMVYWDQRGAGRSFSNHIPVESMNIEQFISDTREVVEHLQERFEVRKVYLVGHSWGSIIGILTVLRHPELFHAYVGIGQVVNVSENEKISYQFALEQALASKNLQAIRELQEIGPPPHEIGEMRIEREWVKKFGGLRVNRPGPKVYWFSRSLDFSTGFTLDAVRWLRGAHFSIEHLWGELQQIDLFEQAPRTVDVPVFFLAGRHDYYAPTRVLERYYRWLRAPRGKQMIWFEKSAHEPFSEQPEKFRSVLIRRVLNGEGEHGR